ncbi:MAG: glycosyltransferase family 4 protein [Actinobacteria bacterium]|nr:glycosyltransferase family 4 protein [Actinomycetota bacterium]
MSSLNEVEPAGPGAAVTPDDPYLHEYFSRFSPSISAPQAPLRVAFLVGSLSISGGTYVILQHAHYLMRQGVEVTLLVKFPAPGDDHVWHPALRDLPSYALKDAPESLEFDLAIATFWRTVYALPKVRSRHYAYLVQSIESRFYAGTEDAEAVPLAELTYTFDLPVITITHWMQAYLALRHRRPAFLVRNGIRKEIYASVGPRLAVDPDRPFRVLLEGAVDVGMKNIPASVAVARAAGADEVWLLTPSAVTEVDGVDRVFSQVPIEETSVIYRSCPVLLKLSLVEGMYGPPLEMFHCGGTVVTNDVTGSDEYVRDGENGLVVPTHDDAAAVAALRRLKDEPELLARLRAGALRTARHWPDWDHSSEEFWDVVRTIAEQPEPDSLATILAIRSAGVDLGM